jgi:uncharacterized protein
MEIPLPKKERIEVLDCLRGVAILGILLINILGFSYPPFLPLSKTSYGVVTIDQIAICAVYFFIVGKFYAIFSFLFGYGFNIQLTNLASNKAILYPVLMRRLLFLFIIGALHALFLWYGDILHIYALLGIILIAFRHSSSRALIIAAIICLAMPIQLSMLESINLGVDDNLNILRQYQELTSESLRIYSQGTFSEIFRQRIAELGFQYSRTFLTLFHMMGMFLLGFLASKEKILHAADNYLVLAKKILLRAIWPAIVGNLIFTFSQLSSPSDNSILAVLGGAGYIIGSTALCFCYIAAVLLLADKIHKRKLLFPLIATGRMALSNYLLQSIICTTIFYSYGFALYGKIRQSLCIVIAIIINAVLMLVSWLWLKWFRFGPFEWVWRSVTYLQIQPLFANRRLSK